MEPEFDNEIDALLRKAGDGRGVLVGDTLKLHLDADEVAAFAENAVPTAARQAYMAHFADCERCRKTLSQVILLNSETEMVSAAAAPLVSAETAVPWYRRLLLFPNLAYLMGGLIVIFGGFLAISIFRNSSELTASVARSDAETSSANTVSGQLNKSSNSANAANMAANAAAIAAPTISNSVSERSSTESSAANSSGPPVGGGFAAEPKAPPSASETAEPEQPVTMANAARPARPADEQNIAQQERTRELERAKEKRDTTQRSLKNQPFNAGVTDSAKSEDKDDRKVPTDARSESTLDGAPPPKKSAPPKMASSASPARRQTIGEREFEYRQGVWYDTTYRGQATINVRRGTDNYKKLDGGLRSIADRLSGTAVIVWKEKAYRIQ